MANTAYVSVHDVRPAGQVASPPAGAVAVARFSAVALTPAGAVVTFNGGQLGITDVTSVAVNGGDTLVALQGRITTLLQSASYFNDGTLATVFV